MSSEKGFSLIENLVAMVVLGIIGVVVLSAITMAARSNIISDEITTAENLARNQMDFVQDLPYDSGNNPPVYGLIADIPTGYTIVVSAARLNPENSDKEEDHGIQQIDVTISRGDKTINNLTDYKVNR